MAFISKQDQKEIVKTIKTAEKLTSGEIRLHIEKNHIEDKKIRMLNVFNHLEMFNTKQRNAVLFHITLDTKSLGIYGDKGIHQFVKQDFWNELHQEMIHYFKQEQYKEGLILGILKVGKELQKYFPHNENDKNELNDEISFS